jgi:1,4-alpha-glucan branching enzyme
MIKCEPTKSGDKVRVTFALPAGDGDGAVAVVGDFNRWNPNANPLRTRESMRSVTITLTAGRRYAFRYRKENGEWFNDDGADAFEPNEWGDVNSIVDLTHYRAVS